MPSTVIRSFDYDPDRQRLTVTFQSGRRYRYDRVPSFVHDAMRQSFSKGSFFNAIIRDRFPFTLETAP